MSRFALPCLVLLMLFTSCFTKAESLSSDAGSYSGLQVVYLEDGTTLTTYNVDPQSLTATQIGQPVNLPMATFSLLIPSLNGEFLYILGSDASQNQSLWVLATDPSGVPQASPVQVLSAKGMDSFEFDPAANFAYASVQSLNSQGQYLYDIRRYTVDPATGKLSAPAVAAKYPVNGPCLPGILGANPDLDGFSANGQVLYDDWYCVYPDNTVVTYYERSMNLQTGALGPDVEVYTWHNGPQGYHTVTFNNKQIIDYSIPNYNQQGVNGLSIYPVMPNSTKALLQCDATMLQACGYSLGEVVHPSGRYIFFIIDYYTDQIASIDFADKKLVDTTHYIPYQVAKFNSDGTIVYGLNVTSDSYYVQIFGFDVATANVRSGGSILAPSISDTFWPVNRE